MRPTMVRQILKFRDLWSVSDHYWTFWISQIKPSKHLLVLKTSSRHVLKTSSTRLQRNNFTSSKTSWTRLEHVLKMSCKDVLKTSSRHVLKTSLTRLQRKNFTSSKTSLRRLENVLKTSWRRLQEVLEDKKLLRWRRLEDVSKTLWRETKYLLGI